MKIIIFGDRFFTWDMMWGFMELGHDVRGISPGTVQELEKILYDETPDLFMTLGSPACFNPLLLQYLGNRSQRAMKCIHWDTDGITWADIEMNHIGLLRPDMVFTVCPEMLERLKEKGIPCEMLFYAFSPLLHHSAPVLEEMKEQIAFTGGAYPEVLQKFPNHWRRLSMDVLFRPLLEKGYRVDFYGDNRHKEVIKSLYNLDISDTWLHGRYPYEETFRIYSSCKINLVPQNHEHTLTKRVFEILGSGGFILSYDNAAIRKFFTPFKDLAVSSSQDQTMELVEYYHRNLDEYNKIRENAAVSAQKHTYKERAATIISKLW